MSVHFKHKPHDLTQSAKSLRHLCLRPLLCCVCVVVMHVSPAYADEFDTLQFTAAVNNTWDNNLFRAANNAQSDRITTYNAGVKFDKSYSQQRFVVGLNYVDNKYQTSDFLDFNTLNYDAAWRWTLTPDFTGTLSSVKSKSLAGFADFRALTQNIRTTETHQFRAEYSPHKVWALIAGFTDTSATNSATFDAIPDFESTAFDYGARYNFASGTSMSVLGHKRTGDFLRPALRNGFLDNGYTEDEFEWDVVFRPSGKSNLSTKLSYLSRKYDNFSVRDYDSWLGFIRYDVLLTGKLKLNAELSRTLGQFDTPYSSYSATDALTANLNYTVSEKFILGLNGRYARRDFKQPVLAGLPSRTDIEPSLGATVTWQPLRNVGLILSTTKSSRDASNGYNNFDFSDRTTSLTLDLKI